MGRHDQIRPAARVSFDEVQLNPDQLREGRTVPLRLPVEGRARRRGPEISKLQVSDATQQFGIARRLRYAFQLAAVRRPTQDKPVILQLDRNIG